MVTKRLAVDLSLEAMAGKEGSLWVHHECKSHSVGLEKVDVLDEGEEAAQAISDAMMFVATRGPGSLAVAIDRMRVLLARREAAK